MRRSVVIKPRKQKKSVPALLLKHLFLRDPQNLHKVLLKLYLSFVMFLSASFSFVAVAPAATETASTASQGMKLESKEGQSLLLDLKKMAAEKKAEKERMEKKRKAAAQLPDVDPEDEKAEGVMNSVEGQISARNKAGMAVEFEKDEAKGSSNEIWLNFVSKMKLNGVKDLSEFQEGDTVRVVYKETKKTGKKILKGITLVQKKPKETALSPQASAAAEAEDSLPTQGGK